MADMSEIMGFGGFGKKNKEKRSVVSERLNSTKRVSRTPSLEPSDDGEAR